MSTSIPMAFLLLLLSQPPVSGGSPPSSLQGARLAREEQHPGHTARMPKLDPSNLITVLDVHDDADQEPDVEGEYTSASLTKPGMPTDFTICGAYRPLAWKKGIADSKLFQLNGRDGKQWGILAINAGTTEGGTTFDLAIAGRYFWMTAITSGQWFRLSWIRICLSIEATSGTVIIVIKPFIYKARESSLVPEGFLTAPFLKKL